jgi:hypothetical protein
MAHALVVLQGFDRRRIPFVKRAMAKTSRMEPKCQAASTGEKFDGFKLFHGFI